jgi:hypothetical protein
MLFEPISIAEQIIYSTVRITAETSTGTSRGTGFYYTFPIKGSSDQVVPVIITNKHVIGDSAKQNFLLNLHDPAKGEKSPTSKISIDLTESQLGKTWFAHPDANVDLCCLPIAKIQEAIAPPLRPHYVALSDEVTDADLKTLDAIEDVIMVGYPNGLWDHVNNLPLVRKGTTASHPGIDYMIEGQAGPGVTVVDMACFPGSSGSPVFVYNSGMIPNKTGGAQIGTRAVFLGVLFSGPQIRESGEIVIKTIPTKTVPVAELKLMINLGYVIKPREVTVLGRALFKAKGMEFGENAGGAASKAVT